MCSSLCLVICIVSELKMCVSRVLHTLFVSVLSPSVCLRLFVIRPSLRQHLMSIRLTSLWTFRAAYYWTLVTDGQSRQSSILKYV